MKNVRVHKDLIKKDKRANGYAIRVGDRIPKNSVNLAYVHSKPVSPENNLILEDMTGLIRENGLADYMKQDFVVYPNEDYVLETESGQSYFSTETLYVTDEFTIRKNRQDQPQPVFYRTELNGRFDIRNSKVLPYTSGYSNELESNGVLFEEIEPDKRSELLYLGSNIRIERNNGPLLDNERYKVLLVREEGTIYRVLVYTNFRSQKDVTYKVIYPNFNEDKDSSFLKEEVLNNYPFFEHISNERFEELVEGIKENPSLYKHLKVYTTVKEEAGYKVLATSDVMITDYTTRPPQFFKHRMEAKLQTRLSEINKGEINIGYFHVQNAVNVENLRSIGKTIYENDIIPEYLALQNSISEKTALSKKDIAYWHLDLLTPQEELNNFDMVVITGYGKEDMTNYRDILKNYLQNGGVVWVDNAGANEQVLDFHSEKGNTFIVDVAFTESEESSSKCIVKSNPYTERLYNLNNDISKVGYDGVNPKIKLNDDELDNWDVLVSYENGNPSIIKRTLFEKGTIIVSNCGVFRNSYHQNTESMQFVLNTFIHHTEEKWFLTPWLNDFVYNRENLYKQEYQDENGIVYIDERNEYNPSQIVAKKILHPRAWSYVRNFVKPWFYQRNVTGEYYHKILNSINVDIQNNGFESRSNSGFEWEESVNQAIPGWNTVYSAGNKPLFKYSDSFSEVGKGQIIVKAKDDEIGSYAFWESNPIYLTKDIYNISSYLKYEDLKGITTNGAKICIYTMNGEKIAESEAISGTSELKEFFFSFNLNSNQDVVIRLGFCDGNGVGTISFENIEMNTEGAVKSSSTVNGLQPVYAFSTRPNANTIDIDAEGFENANITRVQPEVPFTYTIRSFIYRQTNGKLEKVYGPQVSYNGRVKKSDGILSLGFVHFLLPEFPGGAEWSDKNKIYYDISLGDEYEEGNKLVNLKIIDKRTGSEWFNNGSLIIGYKDLYHKVDRPSHVLHIETNYETIRATKRHFAVQLVDNNRITCELPRTQDAKENWYIKFRNGQFSKEELGYKELSEIYNFHPDTYNKLSERTIKKEIYSVKEYYDQVFDSLTGIMSVENEASYINPTTIRVPHDNLLIKSGSVEMEELISDGIVYSYNMIKHGYDGFESFMPGQIVGRVTTEETIAEVSDEHSYIGETSMKVEGKVGLMEVWLDVEAGHEEREGINVVAGQDYFYTFYVFNPFDDPVDIDGIIEFENGSLIGTSKISVSQSDGWKRIELYVEAPSGSRTASVGVRVYGSGPVYFDCFQLEDAI